MAALLTINEFAQTHRVSRSTVYRLRDRNEIAFVHIGRAVRIKKEDAERWFASLSQEGANDA